MNTDKEAGRDFRHDVDSTPNQVKSTLATNQCCSNRAHDNNVLIASSDGSSADMLDELLPVACNLVLERVAEHPNASVGSLLRLARHEHAKIRAAVADNCNTPETLVMELAADVSADVRYAIAENSMMPIAVLEVLVSDENPYVVHRAKSTMERLGKSDFTPLLLPDRGDDSSSGSENTMAG